MTENGTRNTVVAALVALAAPTAAFALEKSAPCTDGCALSAQPSGGAVLYSQLDDPTGSAFTDQQFESVWGVYDSQGADDFQVTSTDCWDLGEIRTPGVQQSGGAPHHVNHFFYADAGGLPGAVREGCDFPGNINFVHDDGDIVANIAGCLLQPGVHWVSQQVRQDLLFDDQHWWGTRQDAPGLPAVWRNPGNGWGHYCKDWSPANSVCGMTGEDYLFELTGSAECPSPPVPATTPLGLGALVLGLGAAVVYALRR